MLLPLPRGLKIQISTPRPQPVQKRKHRRLSTGGGGFRRYNVEIPVINLDIDEKIQQVETEVETWKKIEHNNAIVIAAKGLL